MLRRAARGSAGALCAASVMAAALASGASAAWTPATPVSPAGTAAANPEVAADSAGNTTLVWESGDSPSRMIRTAFRPAGGPWEPAATLISTSNCESPELAINPAGAAVVVADCGSGSNPMRAAYRPAGGAWAGSVPIPSSDSGSDPRVALDDAGNAVAVWETGISVLSAYRPAAGGWAADVQASPAAHIALDPDVAMTPDGRADVVWRHELDRNPTDPVVTVESVSRQGSGAWSTPPSVLTVPATSTHPVVTDEPRMTVSRASQRIAVWSNTAGTTGPILPFLQSSWGASNFWSAPPRFASDGVRAVEEPQVAIGDDGGAVAVWRSYDGSAFRIQGSATELINDPWTTPVVLGGAELTGGVRPAVAVSATGDATVLWRDTASNLYAVSHPAGGAFAPAETISTTSFSNPRVTKSATGDAIAAWSDQASSPLRIVVAVDDVTPPVPAPIEGPSSAARGMAVPLSASASDDWSEPVAFTWDFGDGATATGGSVSHTYSVVGPVTATVTATDAAGNTATASHEIAVNGNGGGDPPGALKMDVEVPKQSWKKIRKARGVKLRCTLNVAGSCRAQASVSRRVAKRLGLKAKRRAKAVGVGSGRADGVGALSPTTFRVKLTRAARSAIGKAPKDVRLKLSVEGSAPGLSPVNLKRKLRIKR